MKLYGTFKIDDIFINKNRIFVIKKRPGNISCITLCGLRCGCVARNYPHVQLGKTCEELIGNSTYFKDVTKGV